jgi:hypothetical protein
VVARPKGSRERNPQKQAEGEGKGKGRERTIRALRDIQDRETVEGGTTTELTHEPGTEERRQRKGKGKRNGEEGIVRQSNRRT